MLNVLNLAPFGAAAQIKDTFAIVVNLKEGINVIVPEAPTTAALTPFTKKPTELNIVAEIKTKAIPMSRDEVT
jgi:hypothetical protein